MMRHGTRRVWRACGLVACWFPPAGAPALIANAQSVDLLKPRPALTRASQIRRLTPEQAAQGYPVRIRGVITMDAPAPDFFIQDSTAGIYVEGSVSPKYPHLLGK